jgi:hypothetical protein
MYPHVAVRYFVVQKLSDPSGTVAAKVRSARQGNRKVTTSMEVLHVDCDHCIARGPACDDCVITVLMGQPAGKVDLDSDERAALSALAEQGLVPPLRLVPHLHPARLASEPTARQNYA